VITRGWEEERDDEVTDKGYRASFLGAEKCPRKRWQ
jgi:hypothetical protein